ncbi:MAG: YmdB family metallophosphoesterase [Oscillospiraceae bacterium]|nr:YmdB family metallophosphoesterase [Oscillospiraceae bacterium]
MSTVKILAVGDVCGEPGLSMLEKTLRNYRKENDISFVVVNGENANVVGITPRQADAIFRAGADVITLGNHTWTRTELQPYLDEKRRILRPANFGPQCPGRGIDVFSMPFGDVCVLNLMGRFTLDSNTDNPFVIAEGYFNEIREKIVLVDFHAEGTSEKLAMGYLLDGKASAVWGTHTHVQTSDACVLPKGTGYISDLGMTGASYSVLGIDVEQSIGKFMGDPPRRYESGKGPGKLEGCIFTIDTETGRCLAAEAVRLK